MRASVGNMDIRPRFLLKKHGSLKKKLGTPDLLILFISTVSHKMVLSVTQEAKKNEVPVARVMTERLPHCAPPCSSTRRRFEICAWKDIW